MADEEIREGGVNDDENVLLDQPVGGQHSAVLPDEELHEQLADEGDGDERTALTSAHQGARGTSTPADDTAVFTPTSNSPTPLGVTTCPPLISKSNMFNLPAK